MSLTASEHTFTNGMTVFGRARRANVEHALRETMERLHAEGRAVRIVDVASGPGRHVIEALRALPHVPASALLLDADSRNVDAAIALSHRLGVRNVICERGDALDPESLATIRTQPTVAIVSGVYELVGERARVLASLRGIHRALDEDGYVIYTNRRWLRRQADMDGLVRATGFETVATETDDDSVFTVSIARRVEASR